MQTGRWDESAAKYLTSTWHSNEDALARMRDIAGVVEGPVLDVATGAGHAAFAFAPAATHVVGLDRSAGMLKVAKEESVRRNLRNCSFCRADAHKLPFAASSFYMTVCRVAPHHFEDPAEFMRETYRVIAPGGKAMIIDTVGAEDKTADDAVHMIESLRDPSHVRNYAPSEWMSMAERSGFTIETSELNKKPLNASEWLERMDASPEVGARVRSMISSSTGKLREYLLPYGESDGLTFHLSEITLLLRK